MGVFLCPVNIQHMTELQQAALKKFNHILMGNGGDLRSIRLYNVKVLLDKATLTHEDELVLKHFLQSDKRTIDQTTYVANTVIYPSSWGHEVTVIKRKNGV